MKKNYEAPKAILMRLDANDILTGSSWNFNCNQQGGGDNTLPPDCSIEVTTDNSQS